MVVFTRRRAGLEKKMVRQMCRVRFVDTTLRDGEQAPGVAFTVKEKIQIARMLDSLGIYQIEAGFPAMGAIEMEAVSRVAGLGLKALVSAWNRATIGDIRASLACGVRHVHIAAPVSDLHIYQKLRRDRTWVVESMRRAVSYARGHGLMVTVGAEDASRADWQFLLYYARQAKKEGAKRLRLADTVGLLEPFRTRELVSRLIAETGLEVEFHAHNDFGLAVANTFAAWRAGARYLDTTVGGLGERAGNCSYEEIVAALRHYGVADLPAEGRIWSRLRRFVARAAGRPLQHTLCGCL
ncbi:MAG: homocitrate synthase [Bacillota bacterium]|uniref:hypothetical protein n=1 Tax=Desulfurispora thermophila TaxID=265470 RepID=UPI00037AFED7|nr:hypothetical protein [Desulfurispora thermophila]